MTQTREGGKWQTCSCSLCWVTWSAITCCRRSTWHSPRASRGGPEIKACTIHVAIYTAAVCLFLWTAHPLVVALIAVPHWLIDRFSAASIWLKIIRGRTFEAAYQSKDPYREFDIAFTSIVYTVTDNTMHLLCLWAVIVVMW